jgi:hypothetical protein
MATIRLGRFEAKEGRLPPVCLRCGSAAAVYRDKVFWNIRWWVYLLFPLWPVFILCLFLGPRVSLRAPLCALHKHHWRWRTAASLGFLGGLALVGGIALVLLEFTASSSNSEMLGILVMGMAWELGPLVWLALIIGLKYSAVHETRVTKHSISLTGVSSEFVEAHRVYCQQERQATREAVLSPGKVTEAQS